MYVAIPFPDVLIALFERCTLCCIKEAGNCAFTCMHLFQLHASKASPMQTTKYRILIEQACLRRFHISWARRTVDEACSACSVDRTLFVNFPPLSNIFSPTPRAGLNNQRELAACLTRTSRELLVSKRTW